jgi:hypothetical protein
MEKNNIKKILCNNYLATGHCEYGNKCLFAHSYQEQQLQNNKKVVFNIIFEKNDLSDVKIHNDLNLQNDLIIMTKECKKCFLNKCNCGLNCNNGVCLHNHKLCHADLTTGKCSNVIFTNYKNSNIKSCINGIHLTEKKLIPLNIQNTLTISNCECYKLDYNNIEEIIKKLNKN